MSTRTEDETPGTKPLSPQNAGLNESGEHLKSRDLSNRAGGVRRSAYAETLVNFGDNVKAGIIENFA